ncbi:DMT family transporter [Loktanella agnita]|uniref:DMT family transporter n=1 Tax=Loktanella agnita TaxID=287097 RepID=UPI0039884B63
MTTRTPNPTIAILFMLAATTFIAGTMLLAKMLGSDLLGPPLHPLQISHGRFLFAFLAISSAVAVLRPRFTRPHLPLHIGRSALGWCGVTLMFAAVAFIPLADATAISFVNPVFGMLLAIPLLGERVGPWRWLAALMAFCGTLILLRPGADTFQITALLPLGAAVLLGLESIFIKKLADREAPLQILLINNAIGLTIATCAVVPVWMPPTPAQWAGLGALGIIVAAAQACYVNAMARADASFVTPFSYLTLVFAATYDAVLFDVIPDRISVTGAAVILTGASLLAWRERRLQV